jgi:DNA/RNA-binding domain of Phe-tRNA-synthetase-like protein
VLKKAGIAPSDFPCAIESLCRQVLAGRPVRSINPMVDFYNQVSLKYLSPFGGWDVGGGRQIALRHTLAGERFVSLGRTDPVFVNAEEISYADEQEILTRHFVWRQSELAKITPQTTEFFLISEVLPELGLEMARQIETAFAVGLRRYFGIVAQTAILDEQSPDGHFIIEQAPPAV